MPERTLTLLLARVRRLGKRRAKPFLQFAPRAQATLSTIKRVVGANSLSARVSFPWLLQPQLCVIAQRTSRGDAFTAQILAIACCESTEFWPEFRYVTCHHCKGSRRHRSAFCYGIRSTSLLCGTYVTR